MMEPSLAALSMLARIGSPVSSTTPDLPTLGATAPADLGGAPEKDLDMVFPRE
ncbi:hypothetical protein [Specibacter sp. NPDC078709]|uniref:hypothetical protein n=1 Tax=Specibacter sp. NPDC078709 TaxID=3154364 RepID=UPI00343F1228